MISEIDSILREIPGWIEEKEGKALYFIAKNIKNGYIVEIGSFLGKSTILLGLGSRDGNKEKIFTVDPHKGTKTNLTWNILNTYPFFISNIKRYNLDDLVIPIIMKSEEVNDKWRFEPIKLLFIDGEHTYQGVKKDIELWTPYLAINGIIAVHDFIWSKISTRPHYGVTRACYEKILLSNEYTDFKIFDSTLFAKKISPRKEEKRYNIFEEIRY